MRVFINLRICYMKNQNNEFPFLFAASVMFLHHLLKLKWKKLKFTISSISHTRFSRLNVKNLKCASRFCSSILIPSKPILLQTLSCILTSSIFRSANVSRKVTNPYKSLLMDTSALFRNGILEKPRPIYQQWGWNKRAHSWAWMLLERYFCSPDILFALFR